MFVFIITSQILNKENIYPSSFELYSAKFLKKHGYKVLILSANNQNNILTNLNSALKSLLKFDLILFAQSLKLCLINLKYLLQFRLNEVKYNNIQGIDVYEAISYNINNKKLYKSENWINLILSSFDIAKKNHGLPLLIHAHSRFLLAGMAAKKIHELHGIPFILTEHSSSVLKGMNDPFLIDLTKKIYNSAEKIIAVSNSLSNAIIKQGLTEKKIYVIPNFVDIYFEKKVTKNHIGSVLKIIHIADFSKNKNHIALIRALEFVPNINISITFVGGGPLFYGTKKIVEELGYGNKISFKGWLKKEEIIELIDSSNILLSTSLFETFGVVILESLSRGRPVISTRSGGPNDLLCEETGILVENNSREIAHAIVEMYNNKKYFNSNHIRSIYNKKFSSMTTLFKLSYIYESFMPKINDD
jgi:glycosyltransferase involved in cell wall biosynthesis